MIQHTAAAVLALANAGAAASVTLNIFENNDSVPTGALVFLVDLVDNGSTVDMIWRNESTNNAVLVNIFVESTPTSMGLLSNAVILTGVGTSYHTGSSPASPAGSVDAFGGSWNGNLFSAEPDTPNPNANAVNPGESLTVRFDLNGSFADLVSALDDPNAMRLAAHVRAAGIDGFSSVWVVSPAPGTAGLLALAGLTAARRRR